MVTPETELIPNYELYKFMGRISDPAVAAFGGYTAHNLEALRAVQGQAVFVAPNHRANIDSFVLGLSLHNLPDLTADLPEGPLDSRPVNFMAKHTLWRYPVVRQVVEQCGAFQVKRYRGIGLEPEQVNHVAKLVSNRAVLCIYPEGTRRPKDVERVERTKLKTTIAYLALKYGVPIMPVGIAGSAKLRRLKLPRDVVFGEPIWVARREDVDTAEFKADKYELMDELHSQIDAAYQIARDRFKDRASG